MAKHAPISPSHVYRVLACPGSVRMCAGRPRKSSKYAAEGTAAHQLGELCLLKGLDVAEFIGATIDTESDGSWIVTEEMAGAVQQYLWEVRRVQQLIGGRLEVEVRVDLTSMIPDMFGTCDAAIIEEFGRGVVIDYKHGAGVPVSPFWNEQMMLYGLGLALKYDLTSITMIIVQPRADASITGAPNWRQFELSTEELIAWAKQTLIPALELAKTPDAPLEAGDHCKFCSAKVDCPAIRQKALEAAQVAFDDEVMPVVSEPVLPAPHTLTAEQLGRIAQVMRLVRPWSEAVEERLYEMLQEGQTTPEESGWKLVQGRSSRKWADEGKALSLCFNLIRGEAYDKPKLRSVAQMEKAFKAAGADWAKAEDLVDVTRATSLVPASDKRPAIVPAIQQFETYTDAPAAAGSVEDF